MAANPTGIEVRLFVVAEPTGSTIRLGHAVSSFDIHTNTVESAWSLFDRAVIGSYHKLSVKHLNAYLDEFAYRFNNRDNPYLFRDTILALVEADTLSFAELTGKA